MTQRDLGIAVGYSVAQICRLENGQRLPELTTIAALFVPALGLQNDPDLTARLLQLASAAGDGVERMTITHTVRREVTVEADEAAPPSNLPASLTSFVGRDRELQDLREMMANPAIRLITLLGPPGVGKTRLALELAWESLHHLEYPDGAWFVDLGPVPAPAFVSSAIRQALVVGTSHNRESDLDLIRRQIRDQRLLLVLDNFEHLLPAAPLAAELLKAAPHLRILATSRQALDLYGENEYPVQPLAIPDLAALPDLDSLARLASVALFVDRARSAAPAFHLTAANSLAVAAICVRLDGLPLALELAAAQTKHSEPSELAANLVNRLNVLERKAQPHHSTLRSAFDWSFDFLSAAEQTLLGRLGVFSGSFSLDAVQAVCTDRSAASGTDKIQRRAVRSLLSELTSKSLVMAHAAEGEQRFRLLETVREFALEKLEQSGEEERLRRQHLVLFTELAERTQSLMTGGEMKPALDRLEMDHDNFRAALQWSLDGHHLELGLRAAAALFRFWMFHGQHTSEGRRWIERAVAASGPAASLPRARALRGLAGLQFNQGEFEQVPALYQEALEIFQRNRDRKGAAIVMANLGNAMRALGRPGEARSWLESSLERHRRLKDNFYVGYCLWSLAGLAYENNDFARAQELNQQALECFRKINSRLYVAAALVQLGMNSLALGRHDEAGALMRQALALGRESNDPLTILQLLEALAYHAVVEETPERAVTLFGAIETIRDQTGLRWHLFVKEYKATEEKIGLLAGTASLDQVRALGRAMTIDQAIAFAESA